MAVPYSFTAGSLAKSAEVNANFAYVGIVPIKTVLPWLKNLGLAESGSSTSVSSGKLIDSTASFNSVGLGVGDPIILNQYTGATNYERIDVSYAVSPLEIYTFYSDGTDGFYIPTATQYLGTNGWTTTAKLTFYYTDSTSADSEKSSTSPNGDHLVTHINPNPTKKVWKVELNGKTSSTGGNYPSGNIKAPTFIFNLTETHITSIDSENQITTTNNYFQIAGISYSIYVYSKLDDRFVECNGQTLSDADSLLNGQVIPNLNGGTYRMLRGASTSGGTGGADTHKHDVNAATQNNSYAGSTGYLLNNTRDTSTMSNLPAYYEVVYIMRVK
jgi:hypothetical protein